MNKRKLNKNLKIIRNRICYIFKRASGKNKKVFNISKTFIEFQDLSAQYKQKRIVFQDLQKSYNKLKQYYLEVNYVLMTYDRQFYKEILEKLYNSMIELKKKF